MARLLLTQSLISSWQYMMDARGDASEAAFQEFISALNRVPKPPNENMQNGIDFEREVYKCVAGMPRKPHAAWENGIQAVARFIAGAPTQVKVGRECNVGGVDLYVYGILDAVKAGVIFDVKFCNTNFNSAYLAGKYLNSPQHPTYFYLLPEARQFKYIVSDGGEEIYTETYCREMTRPFEEIAGEFLNSLKSAALFDVYAEKWASKDS